MFIKSKNTRFLCYAAGIFNCYFYFGILQERITSRKYPTLENDKVGEDFEKFTYFFALCAVQCLANYLFAEFMLYFWPQPEDKTRASYHAGSALTYILAMVCSNMALQWVPYPTQVTF